MTPLSKMGLRISSAPPANVSGFTTKRGDYLPSRDTPPLPTRPGSLDAFTKPSRDFGGVVRPYWASKES